MLDVDKKYIKEFLGDTDSLVDDYCSFYKTYRVYTTINDIGKEKILIVQTPSTYENCYNPNFIEDIITDIEEAKRFKKFNKVISSLKHIKRGNHLLTLIEAK